jgi:PAS domain S-box-containing protein
MPAFDRATRLAKALFGALDASIVLIDDGRVWRSRDPTGRWPQRAGAADFVVRTGELLWLENAALDPRFGEGVFKNGKAPIGLYAAAPVRLSDGTLPGVLFVVDLKPMAFDDALAKGLMDLADTVADECDRARVMERVERSEQRLKLALELADIYVTDLDYERQTLEMAGATRLFDATKFETLSQDTFAKIDPRDREQVAQAWKRHVREGAPYRPEYRLKRENGHEMWVASLSRAFKDASGKVTRVVAASQDITRRKEDELALIKAKEEAEIANRAKSTFLATMSHEIRTPLNGVLGMAQAMAMDMLSPDQRKRLDVIQRSGETLLAILNDVLDLSKIEAGKLDLELGEIDIDELVQGVHSVFAPLAGAKGCDFVLALDPSAAGIYRGDPTRVRQILYNLVSNGLKFTEAGEVRLDVRSTPEGLKFEVRDTGIGISPEHMASLFQKFEQGDASTTRRFGGTGLGLAICRELATLMGGSIRASSELGKGSVFTVALDLPRIADVTTPTPRTQAWVPREQGTPLRVLAAEDNEVNRHVLAALLEHMGAELHFVENGEDAVAAWEADDWCVILMDIHMPGMDGPTATRIIREREQAQGRARTPIIALTANAMSHQVESYVTAGMDDFVAKPIEVGRLFAAIERAVAPSEPSANRAVG